MTTNRRDFLEHLTATAMLGAIPLSSLRIGDVELPQIGAPRAEEFDMSWTAKLAGKKHKAAMDCAEHENGIGVIRSSMWENQYVSTLGAQRADIQTVLILRHNASVLGLTQAMWDKYGIGAQKGVKNPMTDKDTTQNPALLTAADGIPANIAGMLLRPFMERGGIVLVCHAALRNWSATVARKDGVSAEEALTRTLAGVIPGVVVQPSGIFAAVRAQQEGCAYVAAS